MKRIILATLLVAVLILSASPRSLAQGHPSYLGFDRNDYPGDNALNALRRSFAFIGYWLNHPPGAGTNSWVGKRRSLQSAGFGFLVVFNGRTYAQIKAAGDATRLGASDARSAVAAARREGFPARTIIFLDQEQGGRMLPEQRSYLHAWADGVESAGFRAGIYCSGIGAREASGVSVITAEDIRQNAHGRKLTYWVGNDMCPPSPGCVLDHPLPSSSGVPFAEVWQFAQSPKRAAFARGCSNYSTDGNCYPPGVDAAQHLHLDLNVATSSDPSHGRTQP